jgi:hypothetical protein|tara:strand:- start:207 stop:461 length:255 start_codon:yes stop_codon:yes gene_type:complete
MNIVGDGKTPSGQGSINDNLNNATDVVCEECECDVFAERMMIKKVSKFVTGSDRDSISPIPVIACAKCGHVNKEFRPNLSNLTK